ncbi:MAG TPA: glycosyltransferase family 2 protein [Acidimicrobiales bacterium]|jgi:GT2 family glycosyltransferase|nr:glycosyltransferase family 2 protein [Acidimicrobiales bacterium]
MLTFPTPTEPVVSIVMVVYGNFDTAHRTLESIVAATAGTVDFEMVVVDNASPDGAGARLAVAVEGARFVLSPTNMGYGQALNVGACMGRTPFVCALNSDVAPEPGWLGHLVDALAGDPRAGVATPMYIDGGGRVLEAGALLGADGQGHGYGDRYDRDAPELSFARYVDYGSGAALLLRRADFERSGGFDPAYGLGYYEDADLCFALRRLGRRTVFEPRAVVVHAGQASFPGWQRAALSRVNRVRFVDRFGDQLAGRPRLRRPPYDPHRELVIRDWWAPDRYLVFDTDGTLSEVADQIQVGRPDDRVTWLAPGGRGSGPDRPGHRFVEAFSGPVAPDRWLRSRRHHYSAVVASRATVDRFSRHLARTQPQAVVVVADGTEPAAVTVARAMSHATAGEQTRC